MVGILIPEILKGCSLMNHKKNVPFHIIVVIFALIYLLSFDSTTVSAQGAGYQLRVGSEIKNAEKVSFDQIDHSQWNSLLRYYVDKKGQVCYSRWRSNGCAKQALNNYFYELARVDTTLKSSRAAKLAYYINAYNALTIWGILQVYPIPSVQKLSGEKSKFQFFDDVQFWGGQRYLSLNQIENDILRPMKEPRIHFALVCGANGCPRLRNEAYTARSLDYQLTNNAIEFFSKRQRFHISGLTKTVWISPILKWYGEDFGDNNYEIIVAVFKWLPEKNTRWLGSHCGWKLRHLGYDWGLNDRCPTASVAFGRIPYAMYSHISPCVENFLPQENQNSNTPGDINQQPQSRPTESSPSNIPSPVTPPQAPPTNPDIPKDDPPLPPTF